MINALPNYVRPTTRQMLLRSCPIGEIATYTAIPEDEDRDHTRWAAHAHEFGGDWAKAVAEIVDTARAAAVGIERSTTASGAPAFTTAMVLSDDGSWTTTKSFSPRQCAYPPPTSGSRRPGAGMIVRTAAHHKALESAVLSQFTTQRPCDRKANRPPGTVALAEAARLLGPEGRDVIVDLSAYARAIGGGR